MTPPRPKTPPRPGGPPPRPEAKPKLATQSRLFELDGPDQKESSYTAKIKAPIYEPKGTKPHLMLLVDSSKAKELSDEAERSGLPPEEIEFLKRAARRHDVFNYRLIADYYAHASKKMQRLMERSGLVIVDFDDAVRNGFVKYTEEIAELYVKEHGRTKE